MVNELRNINTSIISHYCEINKLSKEEFNKSMERGILLDNMYDNPYISNYDEAVLDTIKELNQNPLDLELISDLLISCIIDEEGEYTIEMIKNNLDMRPVNNLIFNGLFNKWPRIRLQSYDILANKGIKNKDLILFSFLRNEPNHFALRMGLLNLQKLNLDLAKIIAKDNLNSDDKYLRYVSKDITDL